MADTRVGNVGSTAASGGLTYIAQHHFQKKIQDGAFGLLLRPHKLLFISGEEARLPTLGLIFNFAGIFQGFLGFS